MENLLGRPPVQLDTAVIGTYLSGKAVLVTGGGGSIGSELCRQIAKHRPAKLIVVDQSENNAYAIQQELRYFHGDAFPLHIELLTVRDSARVEALMKKYRPDMVFHAAAYKHVPLMEANPREAVENNVFATWHLMLAAKAYGVERFILISTDKAVKPVSVMGATKRLCEMMVQAQKEQGAKTTFAAVRFGNVLGSNGSVVPLFRRQIAAGGPITVTDRRMTRYFMTIFEATQLVLAAGAMAEQNELFVLDMGQPVKILDLAEKLIYQAGLIPYRDIDIVETGLRPGEKLEEELFIPGNPVEKTENEKIFVERQPAITPEELRNKLRELERLLATEDPQALRTALRKAVALPAQPSAMG